MKRLVAFLSLVALCLLSTEALSQTTFTGALGQDWFEPGNWDNGIPAIGNDATIPDGLTVVNDSSLWIGFVINNNGIIDNNGVIGDTILATGSSTAAMNSTISGLFGPTSTISSLQQLELLNSCRSTTTAMYPIMEHSRGQSQTTISWTTSVTWETLTGGTLRDFRSRTMGF